MSFAFKVSSSLILIIINFTDGISFQKEIPGLDFDSLIKIEGNLKSSINKKRSPLEVGFVSFEPDHRFHDKHFDVPGLVRPDANIAKNSVIPIVSKSRMISTSSKKIPRKDHILLPLDKDHHIVIPVLDKNHANNPKIIVDHKELLLDHAANVILDQKHIILEHSSMKNEIQGLSDSKHNDDLLDHRRSHTVFFEHKPVLVDMSEHETNVLIDSAPKTLVVEHQPIVLTHHPHTDKNVAMNPKSVVSGTSRTILLSPKNQFHEIIVHRHVPKAVVIHETVNEDRNLFRSHFGGFGVGTDYGGHGAGHGFHVLVI